MNRAGAVFTRNKPLAEGFPPSLPMGSKPASASGRRITFSCEHTNHQLGGAFIGVLVKVQDEWGIVCYLCSKEILTGKPRNDKSKP